MTLSSPIEVASLYGVDSSICGIILTRDEAAVESINLHSRYFSQETDEAAAVSQAEMITSFWRSHQEATICWEEGRCLECGGTIQPEYHPEIDQICECGNDGPNIGLALDLVSGAIVYPERRFDDPEYLGEDLVT